MSDHAVKNARVRSPIAVRLFLCLVIIALGLSLRRYGFGLGLPGPVVKYGGSILWAAMVFFLVALAWPALSRARITAIAATIAVAVELGGTGGARIWRLELPLVTRDRVENLSLAARFADFPGRLRCGSLVRGRRRFRLRRRAP